MLLPIEKEREFRFKLALRMGIPIVLLASILVFSLLSQMMDRIPSSFIVVAVGTLAIMVYFAFYLIYQGFNERITDPVTQMFTREYVMRLFQKGISEGPYTIVMISIENLGSINERYGIKNGDMVLSKTAERIGDFFEEKGIKRFPIGHFKGGDFLLGFEGEKQVFKNAVDLFCLKYQEYSVDEIEVYVSGAVVDTTFSTNLRHLIDYLVEMQGRSLEARSERAEESTIGPDLLESKVIDALQHERISLMFQNVEDGTRQLLDVSVKLVDEDGAFLHQKSYRPVINRLGLSTRYDEIVFDSVAKIACRESEYSFALSVSPSTLRQYAFLERVKTLCETDQGFCGRLVLVVEEKEYFGHLKRFDDLLQSYRRMGIRIAVDHLGTNPTSLLYMKDLDLDIVRFDNSFGKHIANERYFGLIEGLAHAAKRLGLKSWIGMISDAQSDQLARRAGVDYKQGHFYGKISDLETLASKKETDA